MGAYERDNFGDLLFLLVTERYLGAPTWSPRARSQRTCAGVLGAPVPGLRPALRDGAFDAVWTVGGQVGRVDLERAYKMSASRARGGATRGPPRRAGARLLRRRTGGVTIGASPYIPRQGRLPAQRGDADRPELRRHRRGARDRAGAPRSDRGRAARRRRGHRARPRLQRVPRATSASSTGCCRTRCTRSGCSSRRWQAGDTAIVQVSRSRLRHARARAPGRGAGGEPAARRPADPPAARGHGDRPRQRRGLRPGRARRPPAVARDRHRDPRGAPRRSSSPATSSARPWRSGRRCMCGSSPPPSACRG